MRILSPQMIAQMQTQHASSNAERWRGLGWELAAPFAATADERPAVGVYGHTGSTGTSLWPRSHTYVVLLTNAPILITRAMCGPCARSLLATLDHQRHSLASWLQHEAYSQGCFVLGPGGRSGRDATTHHISGGHS